MNEILHNIKSDYTDKKKDMDEHIKKFALIEKKVNIYKEVYDKSLYKMVNLRNEIR